MTRRRPVTTRRLDLLVAQLDDRDWQVMRSLDKLHLVTGPQIERLHHGRGDAAKQRRIRQLTRLSRLGIVTRLDRRIGGREAGSFPSIYTLDVSGKRLVHPEQERVRRPWATSQIYLAHHLAVTELFVALTEASQAGHLELLRFDTEPGCWRSFNAASGKRVSLRPDAELAVAVGDSEFVWWVEIDRSTESLPRVTAKCRSYAEYWRTGLEEETHGVFPKVLWCVPDMRRLGQVVNAIARLDAEDWPLFAVVTDNQAVGVLAGFNEGHQP